MFICLKIVRSFHLFYHQRITEGVGLCYCCSLHWGAQEKRSLQKDIGLALSWMKLWGRMMALSRSDASASSGESLMPQSRDITI